MKVLISPAKNFNIDIRDNLPTSVPINIDMTYKILEKINKCNLVDFEKNLKINTSIAIKSISMYQKFDYKNANTPAILAYSGILYKYLDAINFTDEELLFCNDNLFILSSFYGVLRSLDLILPYRLEFNFKIVGNLYKFWYDTFYKQIFSDNDIVLSLLSNEYEKTLLPFLTNNDNFYKVKFLVYKQGKYKTISTIAKMVRGSMANYIVKNRICNLENIKHFDLFGFRFFEDLSDQKCFVFIKHE